MGNAANWAYEMQRSVEPWVKGKGRRWAVSRDCGAGEWIEVRNLSSVLQRERRWRNVGARRKILVRLRPHLKLKLATLSNLTVIEPGSILLLAVEREGFDICVLRIGPVHVNMQRPAIA